MTSTTVQYSQPLFSEHYLHYILPKREDWQSLATEAEPIMGEIAALYRQFRPGNEAQTELDMIRPVLRVLGHTFEVQAELAVPQGTQRPDYILYHDQEGLNSNRKKTLNRALLRSKAFAVGDAKYWDCPLDIAVKARGKDRNQLSNKNPSYQIAFYIQQSGLEWGILTNGRLWRLYHKDTAHELDRFYEVDVPALLAGGDVGQFLYFYAFFRRAAFDQHPLSLSSFLRESMDYALGISESLKKQVYEALRYVAQGFLDYPANKLSVDEPETLKTIYTSSLIFLYRLLFIFYAEARDLLPLSDNTMYFHSYSLRSIAHTIVQALEQGRPLLPDTAAINYRLKDLFRFINEGEPPLKIATFNGGLFDPQRHDFLDRYMVGDAYMQRAIDMLARVDGQFIDYRDLSVRNLGTIYEGLLEYHLEQIEAKDGWSVDLLSNNRGERKSTGSYYTPDAIVKYIVAQTVGPILAGAVEKAADEQAKVEAVLAIKVLDPAMGSGHFLVEATEYIARFLVEQNLQPVGVTREAELAYWKRRVVQSCIYGVDLNLLAVELAKLALWLSTVASDRPLSFLDHHLRTGNSLIGTKLASLTVAPNGNGNGAARKAKNGNGNGNGQLSLFDDEAFRQSMTQAVGLMWLVEDNPAQTVAQVKEQEHLYGEMRGKLIGKYGRIANLYTATRYGVKIDTSLWKSLVDFATDRVLTAPPQFHEWLNDANTIASQRAFFHWELEFPEVFFDRHGQPKREQAGFDAVTGNPPWIRQEMFSTDKTALKQYSVYNGAADLSTYFVELGNTHLKERGYFGFIIPNKFVRANYGAALRKFLGEQVCVERLVDFGDLPVFAEATTYPMIVLTTKRPADDSSVKFTYLKHIPSADDMLSDITKGEIPISRTMLTESQWQLDAANIGQVVAKIRADSVPLGEYVDEKIFYGIKTGFNEAFVIDRSTRDKLIADDPKSAEIIKPFVAGRDIKRYRVDFQERYLIFTRHGIDISQYKAIEKHLLQYRASLEPKPVDWNDQVQGEWQGRKPGPYKWYEIQDTIGYYEEFEKPKIMFPDIANRSQFAFDTKGLYSTNTTYIMPVDESQKYILPLLNSPVIEFFFRTISSLIRGDYLRFIYQYVVQIPIRRINFTTPQETRDALVNEGKAIYEQGRHEELLALVRECLASEPEQSDVVHDLLVYLAEQMIRSSEQRHEAIEDFLLDLQGVTSDAELQKLGRLWTPLRPAIVGDTAMEQKRARAMEVLGVLAERQLELDEDAGSLNEEQFVWLVRGKLSSRYSLADVVKVYRRRHPPIAAMDRQIAMLDRMINAAVYALYGLTEEEITVVEGK